jgi:hypothetical protein
MRTENGPDAGGVPRSFVPELPAGGTEGRQPRYALGCPFCRDLS